MFVTGTASVRMVKLGGVYLSVQLFLRIFIRYIPFQLEHGFNDNIVLM
jgi:hypothetical protein